MDASSYRKHLVARLLTIVGASAATVATSNCGARSPLTEQTGATGNGAGGAGGVGFGGAGGIPTIVSGLGGFGVTDVGFGPTTVGVGGAPNDAGLQQGNACIPEGPSGCPDPATAVAELQSHFACSTVTIVGGPILGEACCYPVILQPFPCYVGRTFFVDEGIVKADLRQGRSWRGGRAPDVSRVPPATRRALGDAWARDGLFEHASVASFARFAMQLLALGAPADLVRATHEAAVDEVRHAELCLGLASAYLGAPVEPAPLPIPAPIAIEADLAAIAAEVVMEGCIGETVATVQALDALAATEDPAVREVLAVTVEDETRHAELAWRFVTWAIETGGDVVREAVLRAFMGFRPPEPRREDFDGVDLALYAAHGRQRALEGRAIAQRTMAEIVQPALCALLSPRRASSQAALA